MNIRTRFAPSPTGELHIGSIRTALYAWLFAFKNNGKFILRIDDTDIKRLTKNSIDQIIRDLKWLKISWDEGPYFQSSRIDRYYLMINKLLLSGNAYKCYCSKERLNFIRQEQIKNNQKPRYDKYCYNNHIDNPPSVPYVVRFCNPSQGNIIFHDLVYGKLSFNNQELDDLIIKRIDGSPTYNFCVVIDDIDMEISHVIRGQEHINNTPRQINIFNALQVKYPTYAHVPIIIGDNKKKISKRFSNMGITQFKKNGVLPEALLNYLIRLGWSYGNKEIFSIEEMKKLFEIKKISKSPSMFNKQKLLWINKYYINNLPEINIINHLKFHLKSQNINIYNGPPLTEVLKLLRKRYQTLKEISLNLRYFYHEINYVNNDVVNSFNFDVIKSLSVFYSRLYHLPIWSYEKIKTEIQYSADKLKLEIKQLTMLIRIAITGEIFSPGISNIIYILGKFITLTRINNFINFIKK